MQRLNQLLFVALLFIPALVQAAPAAHVDGLITKPSHYSVGVTLDRLTRVLKQHGMTVFARVDHAAGARNVGLALRPTQVLIFGNPNLGTLLMQGRQTAGIDLPMKALAWKDAKGRVWLSYNDPQYIVERHHIRGRGDVVKKIRAALKKFTDAATAP